MGKSQWEGLEVSSHTSSRVKSRERMLGWYTVNFHYFFIVQGPDLGMVPPTFISTKAIKTIPCNSPWANQV